MPELLQLQQEFSKHADFLSVYLCEAHAQDEWPVGDKFAGVPTFQQHKTVEERSAAALAFIADYKWTYPMYLDTLSNDVVERLGAWPVRLYIIRDGKMAFMARPTHEYTYSVNDLRQALLANLGQ